MPLEDNGRPVIFSPHSPPLTLTADLPACWRNAGVEVSRDASGETMIRGKRRRYQENIRIFQCEKIVSGCADAEIIVLNICRSNLKKYVLLTNHRGVKSHEA
jgi:hypothetical protein